MAATLVNFIKQEEGRFLKLHLDGWWYEASDKEAEAKVSHAFRTVTRETKAEWNVDSSTTIADDSD
jgi:hypothetical protein